MASFNITVKDFKDQVVYQGTHKASMPVDDFKKVMV